MRKKIKYLLKSDLIKNTSILSTAILFSQVMTVLVSPILTRIYSIGDFAVWAIFLAISGQISVIACLRYEAALVIVKGEENVGGILKGAIIINTIISIFTFIAIILLKSLNNK